MKENILREFESEFYELLGMTGFKAFIADTDINKEDVKPIIERALERFYKPIEDEEE